MNPVMTGRIRLLVGWVTLFIIGTDLFVVSPLLPLIAKNYHVTSAEVGWMVTTFSVAYVVGAPWLGSLSDKMGRRRLIVLGLFIFALANLLTAYSMNFSLLVSSRLLAGFAAAAITPSIYAVTGDVAPDDRRGSWLAIVGSGLLMALWTGAPIGSLAGEAYGWTWVFIGLAVLSFLMIFSNQKVWPKKTASGTVPQVSEDAKFVELVKAISPTIFWGTAVYGFYTYLGSGLRVENHFTGQMVALALTCYGIGAVIGSLNGGKLADRFGAKKVGTFSLALLGALLIVIGVTLHTQWVLLLCLALFAFLGYAFFPAHQMRLVQEYPYQRGTFMAWNNSGLYIGITLGSSIGSGIMSSLGFEWLPFVCCVLAFIGSLFSYRKASKKMKTAAHSSTE
jgi:DHA1 family purine base/nucleoside efflux pump-like MFS transporter